MSLFGSSSFWFNFTFPSIDENKESAAAPSTAAAAPKTSAVPAKSTGPAAAASPAPSTVPAPSSAAAAAAPLDKSPAVPVAQRSSVASVAVPQASARAAASAPEAFAPANTVAQHEDVVMDEFASKTLKRVRSVRTERLHLVSTANLPTPAMEQAAIVTGSKPPKTTMLLRAVPPPEAAVVDEETDLVPGVYEGGLKVWECSVDLIEYMLDRPEVYGPEKMAGKRVIELGCGHGLPGVYALRQGAHVVFTDYNREVLEHATIPNVRANCPEALPSSLSIDTSGGRGGGMSAGQGSAQGVVNAGGRAAFYFGDWGGLPEMLADDGEERFDLILTAETLYTATATVQIHRLIETLLAPGGHALVAAKRYYFGCGGSCAHFKQLVAPPMACETACVIDTGVANIREVLLVSWGGGGGGAVTATAGGGAGLTEAMHEDEEEDVQE